MSNTCEITRYGYAKHEEEDVIIIKQLKTSVFVLYKLFNVC